MKIPAFCLGGAVALAAAMLHGQTYSVDWHVVAAGGGSSSGGAFQISGTIGQPGAGTALTGGAYSVTGGFWAFNALQSFGAPILQITLTTSNTALVSWPSPSTGFNLEVNTNLTGALWTAPPQSVYDNGSIKYIIVTPPTGNRFYRLKN